MEKTKEEIDKINSLYVEGYTYKEIGKILGFSSSTINKYLINKKTLREAGILARSKGRGILTEAGRQKISENAKNNILKNGKCWTKPEIEFKKILNDLGVGVRFPKTFKQIHNIEDDLNSEICFQYPLQRYICDYVDEKRKIVYLVNGDFWHANPLLYPCDKLTPIQIHNIRQDKNRSIFLEKLGYKLCVVWESEINWNKELVKEKITATRKMVNPPDSHSGYTAFDSLVADLDWSEKLKNLWFKKPKEKKPKFESFCDFCKKTFFSPKGKSKYCSVECRYLNSRKVIRPSKEELNKLIWEKPMTLIAEQYKVSDKAVAKWIKQYALVKPPIGYWSKK